MSKSSHDDLGGGLDEGVLEASGDFHSIGGAGMSMGRGFLKKEYSMASCTWVRGHMTAWPNQMADLAVDTWPLVFLVKGELGSELGVL